MLQLDVEVAPRDTVYSVQKSVQDVIAEAKQSLLEKDVDIEDVSVPEPVEGFASVAGSVRLTGAVRLPIDTGGMGGNGGIGGHVNPRLPVGILQLCRSKQKMSTISPGLVLHTGLMHFQVQKGNKITLPSFPRLVLVARAAFHSTSVVLFPSIAVTCSHHSDQVVADEVLAVVTPEGQAHVGQRVDAPEVGTAIEQSQPYGQFDESEIAG